MRRVAFVAKRLIYTKPFCKINASDAKTCYVDGGLTGCALATEAGVPLCTLIDHSSKLSDSKTHFARFSPPVFVYTDADDASFKIGVLKAFKDIIFDNKLKEERIGVLEDDKYTLEKFVLFGQAAVVVRDKVLAPHVYEASDYTVDWNTLQKTIFAAHKNNKPLGKTTQTIIECVKSIHPIVQNLNFTQLIAFIFGRNKYVHRDVDSIYHLKQLVTDMKAFQFKKDDPDAELGAALIDIIVEKADVIIASRATQTA